MEKYIVNRPLKSKWIGGMYVSILFAIALLYITLYFFTENGESSIFLKGTSNVLMAIILLIMFVTTASFYTTEYRIKENFLYSWSPFMTININIKNIKKVEKIRVPLHFRVGASFYSGSFYVPSLGWVNSIITNLRDAILITTKNGKYYMITPSNPEKFMKLLK